MVGLLLGEYVGLDTLMPLALVSKCLDVIKFVQAEQMEISAYEGFRACAVMIATYYLSMSIGNETKYTLSLESNGGTISWK